MMLPILRQRALLKQKGLCFWCEQPISSSVPETHPRRLTADHVKPLCEGGQTIPGNVVAACRDCNNGRHSYTNRTAKRMGPVIASAGNNRAISPFAEKLKKFYR